MQKSEKFEISKKQRKNNNSLLKIFSILFGIIFLALFIVVNTQSAINLSPIDLIVSNNSNLNQKYTLTSVLTENIPILNEGETNTASIIIYHHIGAQYNGYLRRHPERTDSNVVKEVDFDAQMKYLSENGYHTTNMTTLINAHNNKHKLPQKTVVLTFDDGYRDFYSAAFPILKKYSIHATLNVITDAVGNPDNVTWDMLLEMRDSGLVTFGSHTTTHPNLPSASATKLKAELEGSKKTLEVKLGVIVNDFCYPAGSYNNNVINELKVAGYTNAVTTKAGKWKFDTDLYEIPRLRMSYGNPLSYFKSIL